MEKMQGQKWDRNPNLVIQHTEHSLSFIPQSNLARQLLVLLSLCLQWHKNMDLKGTFYISE